MVSPALAAEQHARDNTCNGSHSSPLSTSYLAASCPCILSHQIPCSCSYCQHKIRSAKRAARSELSVTRGEWAKHSYAQSDILSTEHIKDEVPRVHVSVSVLQQQHIHGCRGSLSWQVLPASIQQWRQAW